MSLGKAKHLALGGLLFVGGLVTGHARADESAQIRLDTHQYSGPRGAEPTRQAVVQAIATGRGNFSPDLNWNVRAHLQVETSGRHDQSIDVDRLWGAWQWSRSELRVGRSHPWDLSQHPDSDNPWGLLATEQPQSRGLLLGYGMTEQTPVSSPLLLGWIGGHYWHENETRSFAWGVSAAPFFLPSTGTDLDITKAPADRAGRFARRPPGFAKVNNATLPIHYSLDRTNLTREVFLQPQLIVHARARLTPWWTSYWQVTRSPGVDHEVSTEEWIELGESTPKLRVEVKPKFAQRTSIMMHQLWDNWGLPWAGGFFLSAQGDSDSRWGFEVGAKNTYLKLSYLHQAVRAAMQSSFTYSPPRYLDRLIQVEIHVPVAPLTSYLGARYHLSQNGSWIYNVNRLRFSRDVSLDLGADLFSGGESAFFGEWRTNSRVYLALNWRLGS